MRDLIRLSKTVALALRHRPEEFGIELDPEGWTSLPDLVEALQERQGFRDVTRMDLEAIQGTFEKKRFEIEGDRIRAFYGHSTPQKIERNPETPPDILYHGTSPAVEGKIQLEGLKPMGRQHVHLSTNIETARRTGARKNSRPVIFVVDSKQAHENGVKFYRGNQDVWLSEPIPSKYLRT